MKRSIVITIGLLLAIGIIGGGIYFRSKSVNKEEIQNQGTSKEGSLPSAASGGSGSSSGGSGAGGTLGKETKSVNLSDVIEFTITSSSDLMAVKRDGQIVRSSSTEIIISAQKIVDVLDARFSFDGKKLLVKSGVPQSPRWSVYDVQKNYWRVLSIEALDVAWSPADYRIAYAQRRTSGTVVSILDLSKDANTPKNVINLNAEDIVVSWSSANKLLISERPSALAKGTSWTYDIKSGSLSLFGEKTLGESILWEGGGQGLIFRSGSLGRGGTLSMMSEDGSQVQEFTFLTLPRKCSFYKETSPSSTISYKKLLCAVPRDVNILKGAYLPDEYEMRQIITRDGFYSIDLNEGSFENLKNSSDQEFDAERVRVFGKNVYFLNRLDNKIYSIPL